METGNADIKRGFNMDCCTYRFGVNFRQNAGYALWDKTGYLSGVCRSWIFNHMFRHISSCEKLYEKIKRYGKERKKQLAYGTNISQHHIICGTYFPF